MLRNTITAAAATPVIATGTEAYNKAEKTHPTPRAREANSTPRGFPSQFRSTSLEQDRHSYHHTAPA